MNDISVKNHGAVGDGKHKDTSALQAAIDACALQGGGRVHCPAGTYLIGTIRLKSNVCLDLDAGCVLKGSTDRADYKTEWGTPQPQSDNSKDNSCFANIAPEHLVCARDAKNVCITGMGTIDGSGDFFFGPFNPEFHYFTLPAKGWRPFRMLAFRECKNLVIENVTIAQSPAWTLWLLGCDNVKVRGITLRNNLRGPNTDGIDVDCSRNVHISDCHISAGDDCIALKSSIEFFHYENRPCENVVVTNCTLESPCNAIRVGYEGDGPIRNCTFSNIVVLNSRTGINMLSPYHPEYGIRHGTQIENILFSNMVMDVKKAFYLWTGDKAKRPACLRNIHFDNIIATSGRANHIGGSPSVPIENVTFSRIRLSMVGDMKDDFKGKAPYPYAVFGYWRKSGLPWAFFVRHAKNVSFTDVEIGWAGATGKWRGALKAEKVAGLRKNRLDTGRK